ncbi:RNA polymerase sigma factor [Roseateles violae]|uniref:Sigma-70 family RNA polymerase sigma factor n=1 Tax=Roseateles violae TaxID=3058042 RepID=A0ABT8DXD8_9BURK|nr:sigma-70 family RNA polymerase sigma factor [Pelomonas sp. PFR6]MDN3921374.1 sigma-70 family RNA polymerase sigma factor [Pelomonas sp. PFR6]
MPTPDEDATTLLSWLPRLRRYARALAGDRDAADDLVQDTLERAWTRAGRWQGVADMRAWLFTLMHNLHVDGLRRRPPPAEELDEQAPELAQPPAQEQRAALLDLQAALQQLPVEQREVLLLIALEDMAYADVAATLGIPIGTVMSRLSRGRERLRALMEGRVEATRLQLVSTTKRTRA